MKKIIFLFAALIAFGSANAQTTNSSSQTVTLTIPTVSLIKVSGSTVAVNYVTTGVVAGQNLADVVVNGVFLQYTSIMSGVPSTLTRNIYVTSTQVGAATLNGVSLSVTASLAGVSASALGNLGTMALTDQFIVKKDNANALFSSTFNASSSPRLVTGITTCYTGTAPTDGPQVTYKATMAGLTTSEYASLRANTYVFTVLYTLADTV